MYLRFILIFGFLAIVLFGAMAAVHESTPHNKAAMEKELLVRMHDF